MKQLMMLLALGVMLSANKCKEGDGKSGDGQGVLLDRKWVFKTVDGTDVTVPDGVEQPYLRFSADGLNGFGGCNQLMGTYAHEGQKLSFPGVGSTKMYCESTQKLEDGIKAALGRVDSYRIAGNELKLLAGGNTVATLQGE